MITARTWHAQLELSGAVFYYDYKGKQLVAFIDGAFGQVPALISIPKSDVLGVELGAAVHPAKGLTISANGMYLRSRVRNDFFATDPFGAPGEIPTPVGRPTDPCRAQRGEKLGSGPPACPTRLSAGAAAQ